MDIATKLGLRDLLYFQALTEQGSVTGASRRLGVSQPTVSYAIKRLEQEYDCALIHRDQSHHRIELTAAGQAFARHVDAILEEEDMARRDVAICESGKVRFGLPPIVGARLFPSLSKSLSEHGLLDSLDVVEEGSSTLWALLRDDRIDMALLGSVHTYDDPVIAQTTLMEAPFHIIVGDGYPDIGSDGRSIAFERFSKEHFIMLDEHSVHPMAFQAFCRQSHVNPTIAFSSKNLATIKGMIRANLGVGFLASIAIDEADHLRSISLSDQPQPHFIVSFAVRRQLESPLLSEVRDVVTEFFAALRKP